MQERGPGGWLGLAVAIALLAAGLLFNVQWMLQCGGLAVLVWGAMLLIGLLGGAKG